MTKHTPEPWALCYSGSHIFIVDANYNVIASLDFDSKTKEANAALIAKAPEILAENEALKIRLSAAEDRLRHMESDDEFALMEQENHEWEEHCEELEAENEALKTRIAKLEAIQEVAADACKKHKEIIIKTCQEGEASLQLVEILAGMALRIAELEAEREPPLPKMEDK